MDTVTHSLLGAALCSRTGLAGGRRGPVRPDGSPKLTDWTFWTAILLVRWKNQAHWKAAHPPVASGANRNNQ